MRDCVDLQAQMPKTTLINVMDREADFFELFDEQRRNGSNVDLLVRAKHDRKTTGVQNLFETVKGSSVREIFLPSEFRQVPEREREDDN